MANEKREIKVTDKRMFTPEGELREEYRVQAEKSTSTAEAEPPAPAPPPAAAGREPAGLNAGPDAGPDARFDAGLDAVWEPPRQTGLEPELPPGEDYSSLPPELGGPSFYDLVAMMAEPVPIYLGDARLPDGQTATNLEMARVYIDLLDILRQKTLGNLTAQESSFLEDLLYRLRVRYVQKTR